jgi:Sulfatase
MPLPLPQTEDRSTAPPARLGAGPGQLLAWATLAVLNAITIAVQVPYNRALPRQRVAHHLYDAGHMLALGLASAAVVALWSRLRPRRKPRAAALLDLGALAAAALVLGFFTLDDDLGNLADRLVQSRAAAAIGPAVLPILITITALVVPAAGALGRLVARPWLRWVGVLLAVGVGAANEVILQNDYRSIHLYLAWAAAVLGGSAVATLPLSPRLLSSRARTVQLVAQSLFASVAAYTLVVWPGARVIGELYKVSGAVLTPLLSTAHQASVSSFDASLLPAEARPWFKDRAGQPDVPPTAPPSAVGNRIILMLFIDSFRADVLTAPANASTLPNIFALEKRAVDFTMARSPGSGTVYSFTQIFADRYFSQTYWSSKVAGGGTWPHADTSTRFPELLEKAGIPTYTSASIEWMINDYGVVRGFSEQRIHPFQTPRLPVREARELVDDTIARLGRQGDGPLFLFLHFMEAHYPYDRAGKAGSDRSRYLGEIGLIDKELGRLHAAVVQKGLAPRTMTILTADHGEAFGEHHTTAHSSTLYDELLRVPLLIEAPDLPPRHVAEPVTLMDLGPTILDLLGQPTPGAYMGQSLVPVLRGEPATLTRPIVGESRLMRSLVFPDGTKVITDTRKGTIERYDLRRDPGELTDLFNEENEASDEHVGALNLFFHEHILKRKGYVPPYRP